MVLILIGAAVLSFLLGKVLEGGTILAVVVLFALLGFLQSTGPSRPSPRSSSSPSRACGSCGTAR